MVAFDNSYSRFIAAAKIVLPLAALGLLSTLFLFSRNLDPTHSIPYAEVDVEKLAREQRISAPNYAGVTTNGTAISVSAEEARPEPENPDQASAKGIIARLDFSNGTHADIVSDQGLIDTDASMAFLEGGVTIDTSSGYHIETESLTTALDQTRVTSDTTVRGTSPMGELTAGRMELYDTGQDGGGHVLIFKQGVKLIYRPED